MNRSLVIFLVVACGLIATLISVGFYYFRRIRVSPDHQWESLLGQLVEINRVGLKRVALDSIEPSGQRRTDELARELEPDQIWELLGGIEGIEKLDGNSKVLIAMAEYLQRTYPETNDVAQELRQQAADLKWQAERLRMAVDQGTIEFHVSTYAPNVAIHYFLMEQRLKAICERVNIPAIQ